MKRCIIITLALILFLLSGCSVSATDIFTSQTQENVTLGEDATSTEKIPLSDNFDVTYKCTLFTTEYTIYDAQLWLHLDLGDRNLAVSLTGEREAQIVTENGAVQPLEIVTKKEGLSELENTIYRAGYGLASEHGTQYRLTVQLCRYGNKIYGQVFLPAIQMFSLSTQAVICDFLYISPTDLPDNVDLSFCGNYIGLVDIEYVYYPTLSSDPEASIWPDDELSDGSKTSGWFKLLVFVIAFAVCFILERAASSLSINLRIDEMNITFRRCLLLASATVIAIAGLVYYINPYLQNFLTKKFKVLTMSGYGAPVADSCRWLIYIPSALCAVTVIIICVSTLVKARKAGRSGAVLLGVFGIGCLYLPAAYLVCFIAFKILKAVAVIILAIVIFALFATTANSIDTTPRHGTATIRDEYGNSQNVRVTQYGDFQDLYISDSSGSRKLVPDGHGGYKDDNGNHYKAD